MHCRLGLQACHRSHPRRRLCRQATVELSQHIRPWSLCNVRRRCPFTIMSLESQSIPEYDEARFLSELVCAVLPLACPSAASAPAACRLRR